jgi:hypothetical protein
MHDSHISTRFQADITERRWALAEHDENEE